MEDEYTTINVFQNAVRENPSVLFYFNNLNDEYTKIAIDIDVNNIKYINNASEQIKWYALSKSSMIFPSISNPCEDICLYAIKNNPGNCCYIKHEFQTPRIAIKMSELGFLDYIDPKYHKIIERYKKINKILNKNEK